MTNNIYTEYIDYVFASKDKKAIQSFRDSLIKWSGYEYLKDKNGNFTCKIRDIFSSINQKSNYDCGYLHLDKESLKIIKSIVEDKEVYFLRVFVKDEEIRTPKLWQQLIKKYYSDKIDFGFLAVGTDVNFVIKYNPKVLKLISSNNDFWLYSCIEGFNDDKFKEFEFYDMGISNNKLKKLLSEILKKNVTEEEIKNEQHREAIINCCNEIIKKVDNYNIIDVVEIKEILLENLK